MRVSAALALLVATTCALTFALALRAEAWVLQPPLGLDIYMPVPEVNPLTPEKIALGRRLFFDRRLSRERTIACASCHDPQRAFTDGRHIAVGIKGRMGARNVPTLINRVYGRSHFLDGRAESLERQAVEPIQNPREMDMTMAELLARLRGDSRYAAAFRSIFRRDVNQEDLAAALASYVRSILAGDSPFDRYINGDRGALSPEQQAGLQVFRGKGNCTACHVGPTFSDERFHNTGVAWRDPSTLRPTQGRPEQSRGTTGSGQASSGRAEAFKDLGRFAVTGKDGDRGAFRTPTLREIARTAPYMHDGSLATLEDVVEFYDGGGRPNPNIDADIHPLRLAAEEKQALVVFLKSLSGTIREGAQ